MRGRRARAGGRRGVHRLVVRRPLPAHRALRRGAWPSRGLGGEPRRDDAAAPLAFLPVARPSGVVVWAGANDLRALAADPIPGCRVRRAPATRSCPVSERPGRRSSGAPLVVRLKSGRRSPSPAVARRQRGAQGARVRTLLWPSWTCVGPPSPTSGVPRPSDGRRRSQAPRMGRVRTDGPAGLSRRAARRQRPSRWRPGHVPRRTEPAPSRSSPAGHERGDAGEVQEGRPGRGVDRGPGARHARPADALGMFAITYFLSREVVGEVTNAALFALNAHMFTTTLRGVPTALAARKMDGRGAFHATVQLTITGVVGLGAAIASTPLPRSAGCSGHRPSPSTSSRSRSRRCSCASGRCPSGCSSTGCVFARRASPRARGALVRDCLGRRGVPRRGRLVRRGPFRAGPGGPAGASIYMHPREWAKPYPLDCAASAICWCSACRSARRSGSRSPRGT